MRQIQSNSLRGSCGLQARRPPVLCRAQPTAARTSSASAGRRRICRASGTAACRYGLALRAWGQHSRLHGAHVLPTNTAAAVRAAAGHTFAEPAVFGEPDVSLMQPYVGHVAVHVAPGELRSLVECSGADQNAVMRQQLQLSCIPVCDRPHQQQQTT
jgi:hypothetical protein